MDCGRRHIVNVNRARPMYLFDAALCCNSDSRSVRFCCRGPAYYLWQQQKNGERAFVIAVCLTVVVVSLFQANRQLRHEHRL